MTDFMEFLNNADIDTLKKVSGATDLQAERILATRPFASLEDCSRIPNLTSKKLGQMQAGFEQQILSEKMREPENQSEITPQEEGPQETPPKKSRKVTRIILRIGIFLLVIIAIAAAVYFGVPLLYDKFVRPIETNTTGLSDLAKKQATEIARLDGEVSTLAPRISTLESRSDSFDLTFQAQAEKIATLQEMQQILDQKISAQKDEVDAKFSEQVNLTRAIEFLSRSRLYLSQSNFGLAKTDLQASRDILYSLIGIISSEQANALKTVIERLDLALENLPVYPVVAVYDVDTAWQLLVDGLPNIPTQALTPVILPSTATPPSEATPVATPTP